jgi:hypothetical protein
MNSMQNIDLILTRIRRDGQREGIDFTDPVNAFTVWTDLTSCMKYCGSQGTLDLAWKLAGDHVNLTSNLYVVDATVSPLGILHFHRD